MKFNYTIRQLNSAFDDNAVFLRNVHMKKAVLFDCGRLGGLDNSELLDISDVFVSHTHMDHFGGFDRFLRGCLNSGNTIRFYGPEGIVGNIDGKLRGYNWNLVTDYDFTIEVVELSTGGIKCASFSTKDFFTLRPLYIENPLTLRAGGGFTLGYEFFDHGITSVGYRLIEPMMVSIVKTNLERFGFLPGAWLKDLKYKLAEKYPSDHEVNASTVEGEKLFPLGYLEEKITEFHRPQDVTYITDIAPTEENCLKAAEFAGDSNLLIIEAVFMERDFEHAKLKNHLTINLAKKIFLESSSSYVRFLHFASRYDRMKDEFFSELRQDVEGMFFPV